MDLPCGPPRRGNPKGGHMACVLAYGASIRDGFVCWVDEGDAVRRRGVSRSGIMAAELPMAGWNADYCMQEFCNLIA